MNRIGEIEVAEHEKKVSPTAEYLAANTTPPVRVAGGGHQGACPWTTKKE